MRTKRLLAALLLLCPYIAAVQAQQIVLKGDVVTPTEVLSNGLVSISGNKIAQVRVSLGVQEAGVETDSYIFPGLIDLHDHLTWNFLPRWKPDQLFNNRYEWQQSPAYAAALLDPHKKVMDQGLG